MNLLASLALLGLFLSASLLAITNSWRLRLTSLAVQYFCVALLLAQIVIWQVVLVRLIVGAGVVGILILTSRELTGAYPWAQPVLPQASAAQPALWPALRGFWKAEFSADFPFRVAAVALATVAAGSLAGRPVALLAGLPVGLKMAGFLLCGLSLFGLGLSEEPLRAGLSLLTLLSGFELLYVVVEPSLAIVALLAVVDFGVALVVSYLALLSQASGQEPPA